MSNDRRTVVDRRRREGGDRRNRGAARWSAEQVAELIGAFRTIERLARETTRSSHGEGGGVRGEPSTAGGGGGGLTRSADAPLRIEIRFPGASCVPSEPPPPMDAPVHLEAWTPRDCTAPAEPDGGDAASPAGDWEPSGASREHLTPSAAAEPQSVPAALEEIFFEYAGKEYLVVDGSRLLSRVNSSDSGIWYVMADGVMEGNFPAEAGDDRKTLTQRALQIARRSGEHEAVDDDTVVVLSDERWLRVSARRRKARRQSDTKRRYLTSGGGQKRPSGDSKAVEDGGSGRILSWITNAFFE